MPTLAEFVRFRQLTKPGRRRVRNPGRPRPPLALELSYARALRARVELARAVLRQVLQPEIPAMAREAGITVRTDSYSQSLKRVMQLVRATTAGLEGVDAAELALDYATQVSGYGKKEILRMMSRAVGVDIFLSDDKVPADLAAFIEQNVKLITSISSNYFDRVEGDLLTGLRAGTQVEDLADVIEDAYAVPAAKADFIARDQIGKFYGQVAQLRQEELGIESYIWRGIMDERERDMHKDLEGHIFRWDEPPVTNEQGDRNHPGGDYQCRCTAEPIIKL